MDRSRFVVSRGNEPNGEGGEKRAASAKGRGEKEEEDGKSSWLVPPRRLYERTGLSTFDNENTRVFIVARRSARQRRGPLLNPIIATRTVIDR